MKLLVYEKSKYYLKLTSDYTNEYHEGIFIPSRVNRIKDYYIMSFPLYKSVIYNLENKTINKYKNALLFFKKENNTIMFWASILSNSNNKSTEIVKKEIVKSYSKTFITNSIPFERIANSNGIDLKIANNRIEKIKAKYSYFIPISEYEAKNKKEK